MPGPVADVRRSVHGRRGARALSLHARGDATLARQGCGASRDGVRRTEADAVLRSGEARVRDRDVRRSLPRVERRDPRDRQEPAPPLRREQDLRLPLRLRRPRAPDWARAARVDARIRPSDPRERRIDPRILPRAPGPRGNGGVPEGAGGRDPLRHRRRRDASRGAEDRRGSGAAWLEDRRHRHPEDDRQRHLVRAENVRIRDGGHRGAARDVCGQRRGGSGAQRDRTREAHGPRFGVHRGVLGPGQQPRELLPRSRGAVHPRAGSSRRCSSGSSAEATR